MIFNKELDESLRLMLESDRKRRDKIINFVLSIPDDLYQKIYVELSKYNEYEQNNIDLFDREDFCLSGETINTNNCKYSFVIDMIENSITISRYKIEDDMKRSMNAEDGCEKVFEITLYASTRYNNISNFKYQKLGKFIDNITGIDVEYDLKSTKFGNMVTFLDDIGFRKYQKVNCKENNIELDRESLCKTKTKNRVRRMM